jgi:tetratricopeptide (TPR) repeat protein
MLKKTSLIFCSLFLFLLSDIAYSQSGDYQIANRLMQQQNYEEALPILRDLHENNPGAHVFFDRYIECLINLSEIEEAERVARRQVERNRSHSISQIRLAEILHIKGDRNEALSIWTDAIDRNPESIQTYYSVASSMNKRREYNEAIDIYKRAQEKLNSPTLFMNELANAYMQAGRFDESVREFYRMVLESPDQMGMVQQRFLRMRDEQLYVVASFELEDILFELNPSHIAYPQLYQLLTWLLLETEEYRRAFNFAQHYENQTSYTIQSLMSLGSQFLSAGQYSYAAEAFRYYADNSSGSVKFRAMEELSRTYQSWSQHLQQHNLETSTRHLQLYRNAYELGEKLLDEALNYDRADRVFSMLIDISLDQFKDPDKAEMWYNRMKNHSSADEAFTLYAEGRIALFQKNYNLARQALTRADRATSNSNLSERTRYYLSLTDFFAGDPEFAEIQLRSLERRHTSFYANDAIKMRMWIKNGQRADTTGSVLRTIGEGLYSIHVGNYEEALPLFEPILVNSNNPFADDLTVELSSLLSSDYNLLVLMLLERQIENRPQSPQLERMMWDYAVLAEEIYKTGGFEIPNKPPYIFSFFAPSSSYQIEDGNRTSEDQFFDRQNMGRYNYENYIAASGKFDPQYISDLFEEIILKFPDGFYAPYAREKLQSIELTYL